MSVLISIGIQLVAETLYKSQWIQRKSAWRFVKTKAAREKKRKEKKPWYWGKHYRRCIVHCLSGIHTIRPS